MSAEDAIEIKFPSLARAEPKEEPVIPTVSEASGEEEGDDYSWLAAAFSDEFDDDDEPNRDDEEHPVDLDAPESLPDDDPFDDESVESVDATGESKSDPILVSAFVPTESHDQPAEASKSSEGNRRGVEHAEPPAELPPPPTPLDPPDQAIGGDEEPSGLPDEAVEPTDTGDSEEQLDEVEKPESEAEEDPQHNLDSLRRRPGFREELLSAFSQIYKR